MSELTIGVCSTRTTCALRSSVPEERGEVQRKLGALLALSALAATSHPTSAMWLAAGYDRELLSFLNDDTDSTSSCLDYDSLIAPYDEQDDDRQLAVPDAQRTIST